MVSLINDRLMIDEDGVDGQTSICRGKRRKTVSGIVDGPACAGTIPLGGLLERHQ